MFIAIVMVLILIIRLFLGQGCIDYQFYHKINETRKRRGVKSVNSLTSQKERPSTGR